LAALFLLTACGEGVEPMKVTFKQSGGYAGMATGKACELETTALPEAEGAALQSLMEGSGFMEMEDNQWSSSRGADLQTYEVTVESGGKVQRFSFDDMTVPEKAYPLLEFLRERCK
jgi:hypothetical protein